MKNNSYFREHLDTLQKEEDLLWNILEQRNYHSIIKQYVKAVEAPVLKHRYCAPWWQAALVQFRQNDGVLS